MLANNSLVQPNILECFIAERSGMHSLVSHDTAKCGADCFWSTHGGTMVNKQMKVKRPQALREQTSYETAKVTQLSVHIRA
jgi:hypothetical protein